MNAALKLVPTTPQSRALTDDECRALLPVRNRELGIRPLLALLRQERPLDYLRFFDADAVQPKPGLPRDVHAEDHALLTLLIQYVGWDQHRLWDLAQASNLRRAEWDAPVQDELTGQKMPRLQKRVLHALRAAAFKRRAPDVTVSAEPPTVRSLADILKDPDATKPPVALIPRIAWRGRLTVYSAPDKGGKSTLLTAGVHALTTAGYFLGQPCNAAVDPEAPTRLIAQRGTVLWAMLEEHTNDLAIRASDWRVAPERLFVLERPADAVLAVRNAAEALRPDLLVIDPLIQYARGHVKDSGKAEQWNPVMAGLQDLARDLNMAVVVLHHARKSDGGTRDSSEITARADVVLEQREAHTADGKQRFAVRGRWPSLHDFTVRLVDNARYELVQGADESALRENDTAALKALPENGLSYTAWKAAAKLPDSTFKDCQKRLLDRGLVCKDGKLWRPSTATPQDDLPF